MKKLLNVYNETNYSLSDFTFGFELEAYTYENTSYGNLERDFVSKLKDFKDDFPEFINLDTADVKDDGSITPGEECDACDGEGSVYCSDCDGEGAIRCPDCNGEGKVECNICEDGIVYIDKRCKDCKGTGKDPEGQLNIFGEIQECQTCDGETTEVIEQECPKCEGTTYMTCSRCNGNETIRCPECYGDGRYECPECDGGSGATAYEFASPVFKFSVASIQKVIHFLQEGLSTGVINTNDTCGFHIHLGFPDQFQRSQDIFWVISKIALEGTELLENILYFEDRAMFGSSYAPKRFLSDMAEAYSRMADHYIGMLPLYQAKGKTDKDDMGAYNLDVEEDMYKGYQEDFYLEAKIPKDIQFYLLNSIFKTKIASPYYTNAKMRVFGQHPQGTLEWRGPRAFMNEGRTENVKTFFIEKLYPFVKWITKALNEDTLIINNEVSISRTNFDLFLKGIEPPARVIEKMSKVDIRFDRSMDRTLIPEIIKLFPKDVKMQGVLFSKGLNGLELDGAYALDLKSNIFPEKIKSILKAEIIEGIITGEHIIRASNFKNCKIDSTKKIISASTNFQSCIINAPKLEILNSYFSDCKIQKIFNITNHCDFFGCIIDGGTFDGKARISSTRENDSVINNGFFENASISNTIIKNGKFIDCVFGNDVKVEGGTFDDCFIETPNNFEWRGGNWIIGRYRNYETYGSYIDIEESPDIFIPEMYRYMAAKRQNISINRIPEKPEGMFYLDFIEKIRNLYL